MARIKRATPRYAGFTWGAPQYVIDKVFDPKQARRSAQRSRETVRAKRVKITLPERA